MDRSEDYWEDLAAMQDWPERLPAIGLLLDPSERADRRRRSLEERERCSARLSGRPPSSTGKCGGRGEAGGQGAPSPPE